MRKLIAPILCLSMLGSMIAPWESIETKASSVIAEGTGVVDITNMKRIIVEKDMLSDSYGANEVYKGSNYYTLEFEDEQTFESAYSKLVEMYGEEDVYKDQIISRGKELNNEIQLFAALYPNQAHGMEKFVEEIEAYAGDKNSITVGIIDSGIDRNASYLEGRLNEELCKNFLIESDRNENNYTDDLGHGTMVSYVVKTCSGTNVEIVMYRVFDGMGYTTNAAVKNALNQAYIDGVDIVNMSLGGTVYDKMWDDQLETLYNANVPVVAAAGNETNVSADATYPAKSPYTICVSAVGNYDYDADGKYDISSYSSYGETVTFSAIGGTYTMANNNGGFSNAKGTSFAAPSISAQIADLMTFYGEKTVDEYIDLLKGYISSDFDADYEANPNYHSNYYGYGYTDFSNVELCECKEEYCRGLYHEIKTLENGIQIDGFQISTTAGGVRTVYSVEPEYQDQTITEVGMIYGIVDKTKESDIRMGSSTKYVKTFAATEEGKVGKSSDSTFATSYAMTIDYDLQNVREEFLTTDYYVRAYAKLDNGRYMYSDIEQYCIYDIADTLYTNLIMTSEDAHNYLYDNILARVDEEYDRVDYLN